ncbi:hypothetical protein OHAE_4179 [Ochrobactrum soli]|uniref:Uncharacterized protein n=1 Tax=Ochrobactrum soli TaxID=2448455 RepID=A0A2P9HBC0_9HYPH|nr:hypothetical protein OHAE_4179 [[Ochrobactrum] soli]
MIARQAIVWIVNVNFISSDKISWKNHEIGSPSMAEGWKE